MIKRLLRNFISKHLFKMIVEKDFLRVDKAGKIFIKNHELSKPELEAISKSAKDLKQNDVYILIMRELWNTGEEKIFFNAAEEHGRSVLWTLDLIIKKVDNLSRLSK